MDTSYEQDIIIDENNLDYEWDRQPSLMMKWSLKHAHSLKVFNQREQNLKIVRAEAKTKIDKLRAMIDIDIRKYPNDYDLPNPPSERAIDSAIITDPEFIKMQNDQQELIKRAVDDFIDAVEEEKMYAAAVKAMQARKKSLENLAALYMNNYHSEPKQPSGYQEDRLRRAKQIGGELREGLNRRRVNGD